MEDKWGKTIKTLLTEKDKQEKEWQGRIKADLASRNFFARLRALGRDFAKTYFSIRRRNKAVGAILETIESEIGDIKDSLKK